MSDIAALLGWTSPGMAKLALFPDQETQAHSLRVWEPFTTTPDPSHSWSFNVYAVCSSPRGKCYHMVPALQTLFWLNLGEGVGKNLKESQALMEKYPQFTGVSGAPIQRYTRILTSHICEWDLLGKKDLSRCGEVKDLEMSASQI